MVLVTPSSSAVVVVAVAFVVAVVVVVGVERSDGAECRARRTAN